jgi:polygalacturonase
MRKRLLRRSVLAAGVALAVAGLGVAAITSASALSYNVRDYGATGDGSTNDTPAINAAINAANSAGGGVVVFPSGNYKSKNSIHMKSNVTLQLDAGSTILGSSADTYDAAESNPYDAYQDYGHSHFHDAMIWGDGLTNIGFTGSGTIDGAGNLITGNPGAGEADKIISLTRCDGLTLSGITLKRGGHFAALTNGCNHITSDHLTIATSGDRDGWNVISAQYVTITNITDAANDDALVFKSDWALGQTLPNGHVTVDTANLSAVCCNALMFGSETCGNFTDYQLSNITITGAGKSGLGMVSMDGANISDVHYRNVTMSGTKSPIMQKIGTRKRCGGSPGVGHISNITYDNVTGSYTGSGSFSPTIWGEAGSNQITNVTFNNVNLEVPGGSAAISTAVPSNNPNDYNPNSIGTRPSFGWYVHNASNIHFTGNSQVHFRTNDDRPAVIANTGSSLTWDTFVAERGSGSAYDMGFQTVAGYCVSNSHNTTGGALRINTSSSTQQCGGPTTIEAESAALSGSAVAAACSTCSGGAKVRFIGGGTGNFVTFTVNASTAGSHQLTIGYEVSGTRDFFVSVNGAAGTDVPATGTSWSVPATTTITVPLNAGTNTIRFYNDAANAPDLDYVAVS